MTPPSSTVERTFAPEPASVSAARRFVRAALEQLDRESLLWPVELLISELAANAVLHAGTAFTVRVNVLPDGLRLEVTDGTRRLPSVRHYGLDATTGRGMSLVEELAEDWGVERHATGKAVWCQVVTEAPDGGSKVTAKTDEVDLNQFLSPDDIEGFESSDDGRNASQGSASSRNRLKENGNHNRRAS